MRLWRRSVLRLLAPLTAVAVMTLGSVVPASASPVSDAGVRLLERAESLAPGEYVYIIQKKTGRYLDAHEIGGTYDFNVVTRPFQDNYTQLWYRMPVFADSVGTVYEVMQVSSGRFLDAHEIGGTYDFRAVTRERQFNSTQYWWMNNQIIDGVETTYLDQWSSGRSLQAYDTSSMDYRAVTRLCCASSQIWYVVPVTF